MSAMFTILVAASISVTGQDARPVLTTMDYAGSATNCAHLARIVEASTVKRHLGGIPDPDFSEIHATCYPKNDEAFEELAEHPDLLNKPLYPKGQ